LQTPQAPAPIIGTTLTTS